MRPVRDRPVRARSVRAGPVGTSPVGTSPVGTSPVGTSPVGAGPGARVSGVRPPGWALWRGGRPAAAGRGRRGGKAAGPTRLARLGGRALLGRPGVGMGLGWRREVEGARGSTVEQARTEGG